MVFKFLENKQIPLNLHHIDINYFWFFLFWKHCNLEWNWFIWKITWVFHFSKHFFFGFFFFFAEFPYPQTGHLNEKGCKCSIISPLASVAAYVNVFFFCFKPKKHFTIRVFSKKQNDLIYTSNIWMIWLMAGRAFGSGHQQDSVTSINTFGVSLGRKKKNKYWILAFFYFFFRFFFSPAGIVNLVFDMIFLIASGNNNFSHGISRFITMKFFIFEISKI